MALKVKRPRVGRDIRRQQVFDAAIGVFAEYGYEKASLDNVAKKLKVTKPALYLYFKNKEDLFLSTVFHRFDTTIHEVNELQNSDLPGKQKLRIYIKGNIEFLFDNMDVFRLMQSPPRSLHKKLESGFKKKTALIYESVQKILGQCRQEGLFTEDDIPFLMQCLLGLVHGSFGATLGLGKKPNVEKMTDRLMAFFIKGANS